MPRCHWRLKFGASLVIGAWLLMVFSNAFGQGTAFTYQGQLQSNGGLANGTYNLQFSLYTNSAGGVAVAGPVTNSAVTVTNGLFTVIIDFGSAAWSGATNWLQIGVASNGISTFAQLNPRQEITPTPYSIFAENLSGAVSSANLAGSYTNPLDLNNGLNEFYGTFSGDFYGPAFIGGSFSGAFFGDGSGLYNLPAWRLTGNPGTTAGLDFVGTTDNQPLELHVNSQRALRLVPDTSGNNAPDIIGGSPTNTVLSGLVGVTISGGAANAIGPSAPYGPINPYGDVDSYPALGASFTTIGGGFLNEIQSGATFSTIAGGATNTIQAGAIQSTIGGGFGNNIFTNGLWSVIAGGTHHSINSQNGFIGGGWINAIQLNSGYSTIGGGQQNVIQNNSSYAAIAGGGANTIQTNSSFSAIAGGVNNTIQTNSSDSAIAGGYFNMNGESYSVIGGGYDNILAQDGTGGGGFSVIGGGYNNAIYEYDSFIGGGQQNLIMPYADHSVISGGESNQVVGSLSVNVYGAIGGGYFNTILTNSTCDIIPGGYGNVAGGFESFAAGTMAQATNTGTFVWSDDSTTNSFGSTGTNQFLIRAAGGVGIGTNNPAAAALHVVGASPTNIALRVSTGGIAVSGAGIGTGTAAFIQISTGANTSGDSTYINNPLCNGDPNALLIVTHNYDPPNGSTFTLFNKNFGVWYNSVQWAIYTEDQSAMPTNIAFNVLIIKR
ncbi:MAG TPA: hypothetical protein VME24_01905 [Alphaproteobacteria bacterium]|nr:hypothetical protein [Alphaproteobacteria bacterium]